MHAWRGDRRARRARPTAPRSTPRPTDQVRSTVDADATVKGNSYLLVKKEDNPDSRRLPVRLLRVQADHRPAGARERGDLGRGRSREHHCRHAGAGRVRRHRTRRERRHGPEHHRLRQDRRARAAVGRPARLPGAVDGDRPRDLSSTLCTRARSRRRTRFPPTTPATCPSSTSSTPTTRKGRRSCWPRQATPTASTSTSRSPRAASAISRPSSPTGRRSGST